MNKKVKFLRNELERIRALHGGILQAEDVLEEARNPDSPLHPMFEWDDQVAAHQYRLEQARALIREVRVEVVCRDEMVLAPLYVRQPSERSGYIAVGEAAANPDDILLQEDRAILALLERRNLIASSFGIDEPRELKRARLYIEKRTGDHGTPLGHAA
jgi:hypothetical protein